ncbi:uncharacterized protein LOC142107806 isoform X2 [Mixophyes fleayi]|uniref:uncharacterized protein LOC142107806 isoform X2 n=1 Tax=Mixophyes fleayi TaxID=3061075 RepID=UPI003F4E28F0
MKFSYIGALCVFMALIAAAQCNSITCNECWSIGSTECCGVKNMTCPEDTCMTISEYCNITGIEYPSIRKTCGSGNLCNRCFSLTTGLGFQVLASTQCDVGNGSNADLNFARSCGVLSPNGKQCPRCYNGSSADGCDSKKDDFVACVGEEFQCADYAGVVQYSDGSVNYLSVKGCIVTGGCEATFVLLPGSKELARKKFNCVNATAVP